MDLVEFGARSLDRIESTIVTTLRSVLTAKNVAEVRQDGCQYAEGTCPECSEIARGLRHRAGVD